MRISCWRPARRPATHVWLQVRRLNGFPSVRAKHTCRTLRPVRRNKGVHTPSVRRPAGGPSPDGRKIFFARCRALKISALGAQRRGPPARRAAPASEWGESPAGLGLPVAAWEPQPGGSLPAIASRRRTKPPSARDLSVRLHPPGEAKRGVVHERPGRRNSGVHPKKSVRENHLVGELVIKPPRKSRARKHRAREEEGGPAQEPSRPPREEPCPPEPVGCTSSRRTSRRT